MLIVNNLQVLLALHCKLCYKCSMKNAIERAVEIAGGQSELSRRVGVKRQAIGQWITRGVVPARRCMSVSAAVQFKVSVHELNPEVFGGNTA